MKIALLCISTLTLRSKENSEALADTGIAADIIESMRAHSTNSAIQRNGAWAIRNIVSRSRHLCDSFLNLGAEDLLNEAMQAHPNAAQDIKSALRDLGCEVSLKEEWTGTSSVKIRNE